MAAPSPAASARRRAPQAPLDAWALLDALPDAVVVLEEGPVVAFLNRAAEALLGQRREEAVGRPCSEVLNVRASVEGRDRNLCELAPLGRRLPVAKGLPERTYELWRGPSRIRVAVRCAYEKDERHVVRRIVCAIRDARPREGSERQLVQLVSTASHELRSPLTSVKGFTKTLLDRWDRFDDQMKQDMLRAVNADADRVKRLIDELLDLSRLETGRLRLQRRPVVVEELARRVVERLGPTTEVHQLRMEIPPGLPLAQADPDRVEQVLTNLIENAIKYTEGGTISVAVEAAGDQIWVRVSDEGKGIPPSEIPRLFRKYARDDRTAQRSGMGLGLYIAKGIIEAHGGELTVTSVPGRGSTFSFSLPAVRSP